jgi:hypothetical protein
MRGFLLAALLVAAAGGTASAADPLFMKLSGHAAALREGAAVRVDVEKQVFALLEKWTAQAKRIAEEAEELAALGDLRPACLDRVVTHLEGNLEALDRGVDGITRRSRRATAMNDNTAAALKTLSKLVSTRASKIHACEERCGVEGPPEEEEEMGPVARPGNDTASAVDCAGGAEELRHKLEGASRATTASVQQMLDGVGDRNKAASAAISGSGAKAERSAESQRRTALNEYMSAKGKHEELSKRLRELLAERADSLEGARHAQAMSNAAIRSLRSECETEAKRHSTELGRSRSGAETFLDGVGRTVALLNESVTRTINENDREETYAMSLAAEVDRAADKCVRQLESFTTSLMNSVSNFHKGSKAEESKIKDHMTTAVKSFFRGGAASTKAGHDEKMLHWASETIATDRDRRLNGGPKASEIPVGLLSVAESGRQQGGEDVNQEDDDDQDEEKLTELRSEAAVVNSKLRSAEKSGRVGKDLPPSLVANVEKTSEELWNDLSKAKDDDLEGATQSDEADVAHIVSETTQLDDDLVNPKRESQVPLEYAKLAEELGEAKAEGDI